MAGNLNVIGPGVMIERRGGRWTIRFRLPEQVVVRYALPKVPRLRSRLPEDATRDDLVREANRVGAKLDMLIRGEAHPSDGQSLAGWLGLPEPAKRKKPRRSDPAESLWPDLVAAYATEFKAGQSHLNRSAGR